MKFRVPLLLVPVVFGSACADDAVSPARAVSRPSADVSSVITVVMSGLNSPRGLGFGPEGGLYVAEAGTTQLNGACGQFFEGAVLSTKCYSGTGSVSRLWHGGQERVATGLPSTYVTSSNFASGPQDISFAGRGHAMVAIGWGGPPELRTTMGGGAVDGARAKPQRREGRMVPRALDGRRRRFVNEIAVGGRWVSLEGSRDGGVWS